MNLQFHDKNIKDMVDMMDHTFEASKWYSRYSTDKYLGSFCMCVDRAYRKCGIAKELLKTRPVIMKELGLIVTVTCFSVAGSQKAAESVGFEEIYAIRYSNGMWV